MYQLIGLIEQSNSILVSDDGLTIRTPECDIQLQAVPNSYPLYRVLLDGIVCWRTGPKSLDGYMALHDAATNRLEELTR